MAFKRGVGGERGENTYAITPPPPTPYEIPHTKKKGGMKKRESCNNPHFSLFRGRKEIRGHKERGPPSVRPSAGRVTLESRLGMSVECACVLYCIVLVFLPP